MGWTSTGDPYANVGDAALCFDSKEAAMAFAEKHGWEYVVCLHDFLHVKIMFCDLLQVSRPDPFVKCRKVKYSIKRCKFPYLLLCNFPFMHTS